MTDSNPSTSLNNPPPPTSRFPPELLVKIFECLVTNSNPAILLQICHRWADIASSVSALWSRIDFSTRPEPLLQRCAHQPIDIILLSSHAVPTHRQRRAARDVLFHYNDRIRKLVLDLLASHLQSMEPEIWGPFPILVDVSISVWRNRPRPGALRFPEWKPTTTSPSPIRYFKLLRVYTPWVLGRFQNLVEFFLHDQPRGPDPPMEVFLGILESSPQLTVLSVVNAGPRLPLGSTTLPPARRVIHLHNLEHLYLDQGEGFDIGWMLIHLHIPVSTKVRIYLDIIYSVPPVVFLDSAFELALPNHPGFPHLTNLHRCTYAVDHQPSCVITAPNFAFKIIWHGSRHFDGLMTPFLRRVMAVGMIEDFTIIHHQPWTYDDSILQWDEIFGTLHSLQTLRVNQLPGKVDLSIWAVFQSQPSPALRELRLSFLMFDEESQGEEGGENRKELARSLVDYCAERNRRGYPLERLVIEAPINLPSGLPSLLAPHVGYFEVREEVLSDGDIQAPEFGSRRVFDSIRAGR